jgi:hypothetical protein
MGDQDLFGELFGGERCLHAARAHHDDAMADAD